MTAGLDQAVPSAASALTDRYGRITSVWYPWFVKILDFVNGIARGELIVDGAITAGKIDTQVFTAIYAAVDTLIANEIAALQITADQIDAANIDVLNGTFGTLQTNNTSTRVQITDASNQMQAYVGGQLLVAIGADTATYGSVIFGTSNSVAYYPAYFTNSSTSGGDLGSGGGALLAETYGGYALQATTSTSAASVAVNAKNTASGGGHGQVGRSTTIGGWSFYDVNGGGYGPFTGAHDAMVKKTATFEPGDIVVDGPVMGRSLSDVMTEVDISTTPNHAALGVFVRRYPLPDRPPPSMMAEGWDGYESTMTWLGYADSYDLAVINSIGEGCVNVCGEGGNIAAGDLIVTSSMPGKGMRQADDFVRSYTVARARESMTFASPTDVALIACIYTSG